MIKHLKFSTTPFESQQINLVKNATLADNKTSVELVNDSEKDASFFRSLEEEGINLNKQQIEATRHFDGPALVLAGAGSGKTRVLTSRTGYLISVKKVNPKTIMLVTFTKKAADEMKTRISQLPGLTKQITNTITVGTFHSIFYRLLKSRGYNQQVLSSEKRKQLTVKLILKEKNLNDSYEPETLLAILSSFKNKMQSIDDFPSKTSVEKEIKEILQKYEYWKKDNNLIDFDDMLLEAYHLLKKDEQLLQSMQVRFNYILCDEWQDTNPIQFELIKLISKPNNNLFVVGDDDQTIYTFNGADSSIILKFEKLYPNTKVITLDINYRSTASIIGLANQVIEFNQFRNKKTLIATNTSENPPYYLRPNSTDDEAIKIIEKITMDVQNGSRCYSDFVILHRTNSSSRAIFDQLVIKGIPFITYTKGETFYEQNIVKPVIDHLRLSLQPADVQAIETILPTLFINRSKGIYHIEAEQLLNPVKKPIKHLLSLHGLRDFQKKQIQDRVKLIENLKDLKPVQAIKRIRDSYDNYLEANERKNITLHKEMVLETLAEIEASAAKFNTVAEYVAFIDDVIEKNKEMETIRRVPDANAISLMTIHRSKGLEYPVVFLTGASEGILPHSSALEANDRKDLISADKGLKKVTTAIEEERRLAYVAITRAKQELYVSSPAYYRGEQVEISRFILDPFTPEKERSDSNIRNKSDKKHNRVLIWDCTSDTCNGWMKITTHEETLEKNRQCPMCKGIMEQGVRFV
ncbi:AAA family ATPase [Aquibacillus halophilus]|uniref:DNA 3'-5' helicase n=1 Tax=Aquibacillus halophilus TaxID=930132 RepID=A0A6A8DF95_9BACI|nr:UvrD-helicase domain-containing protein [Aquibacillus halophilus]MRH43900.1 AAA family ATPase [Aquibacillus halophilus]